MKDAPHRLGKLIHLHGSFRRGRNQLAQVELQSEENGWLAEMKSYIFIMKYKTNSQCSFEFECLTWLLVLAQSQSLLFISAICYLVTKKSLAKPLSPSAHTNIQTHPQSQRLDTPECLILSGIALFRAFRCDVNF